MGIRGVDHKKVIGWWVLLLSYICLTFLYVRIGMVLCSDDGTLMDLIVFLTCLLLFISSCATSTVYLMEYFKLGVLE